MEDEEEGGELGEGDRCNMGPSVSTKDDVTPDDVTLVVAVSEADDARPDEILLDDLVSDDVTEDDVAFGVAACVADGDKGGDVTSSAGICTLDPFVVAVCLI